MDLFKYITGAGVVISTIMVIISVAIGVGWIIDIFKIIHSINNPITPMFILRCFGIPFVPLGGILGLFA